MVRAPPALGYSEPEPRSRRNRRCAPRVDGGDDLLGVDALEVDARGAEVGVPELALDDVQRDALARELDSVGVAQLMRREPSSHASQSSRAAELDADRCTRPGSPARSVYDAEQRAHR